jgi:hypothetical protein
VASSPVESTRLYYVVRSLACSDSFILDKYAWLAVCDAGAGSTGTEDYYFELANLHF